MNTTDNRSATPGPQDDIDPIVPASVTEPVETAPLTGAVDDSTSTDVIDTIEDTMTIPTRATTRPASSQATPTMSPAPTASGPTVAAPEPDTNRRSVRVGTMVWGLVLAAVGAAILAFALGFAFDPELALIVVITAAGALLLIGSIATTRRHRD